MRGVCCVKGIIFNLLEDVITDALGTTTWDDMIVSSGASGVYASLGTYPDGEFFALVDAAADLTSESRDLVLRRFGEAAFPRMVARYPVILEGIPNARTFLLSLNRILQTEIRKIYDGAACPHFRFAIAPNRLRLGYASPRQMCGFAEGLLHGVARHFGESVEISHPECIHRGDHGCRVEMVW